MCRLVGIFLFTLPSIAIGIDQPVENFCQTREPLTGTVYDFSSLINPLEDYELTNEKTNETVRFQLCHQLHNDCKDGGGYAACAINGNETIPLGKYPPKMLRENGQIVFQFIGDLCKGDESYGLNVIMHCDFSETDAGPVLFPYVRGQCQVFILWKTKLACGSVPPKSVNCTINNAAGDVVDLSTLQSQVENYVIDIDNASSIILNVCHSVIPGYGAICSGDSGACLRDKTTPTAMSFTNIGDVQSPKLINNTITLHYNMGRMCSVGIGDNSETTISFICAFKAHNTFPVLQSANGCHYKLLWKTAAACSEKELEIYSSKTASSCKVTNPVTNYEYNLEVLKGEDYIVSSANGEQYKFSICGPLLNEVCEANAGVCRARNHTTEGQANSKLLWSSKGPYLNYTNGSLCGHEKRHFTIIAFTCSIEKSKELPEIVIDEPCYMRIQWNTPLACEGKNITCNVEEDSEITDCSNNVLNTSSSSTTPAVKPIPKENTDRTNGSIPNSSSSLDSETSDKAISTSNGGLIALIVLFTAFGLLGGIYLSNSTRRAYLYAFCCSFCLRRSSSTMQYSQINTLEETDLLLDATDICCQSGSDDDLLRI